MFNHWWNQFKLLQTKFSFNSKIQNQFSSSPIFTVLTLTIAIKTSKHVNLKAHFLWWHLLCFNSCGRHCLRLQAGQNLGFSFHNEVAGWVGGVTKPGSPLASLILRFQVKDLILSAVCHLQWDHHHHHHPYEHINEHCTSTVEMGRWFTTT